jgi:hypothetical protein
LIKNLLSILTLVAALAGGYFFARSTEGPPPLVERSPQPSPALRIEQVQQLAALVTLHVPITDVHTAQIEGLTGSVKMTLAVRGDVDIATDLSRARFEDMNPLEKSATLLLPHPEPMRPRLNHERTRVINIHRTGMWKLNPGQAGEQTLTNQAMRDAQRILANASQNPQLIEQGCQHTQQVFTNFFEALGWNVQVQWDDDALGAIPKSEVLSTALGSVSQN